MTLAYLTSEAVNRRRKSPNKRFQVRDSWGGLAFSSPLAAFPRLALVEMAEKG